MAILLITHDLAVVAETADRVIVMYCGRIVETATADELFNETPLHPYTFGLLQSIPSIDDEDEDRLYMIPGMVPDLLHLPPGCSFAPRCPWAFERCYREQPPIYSFRDRQVRCFLYEDATDDCALSGGVLRTDEALRAESSDDEDELRDAVMRDEDDR
jgi:oligopeptide/dipeptide ABC transporter ATP-binding protein